MSQDPFGARFVAGYDEPPIEACVRTRLIMTMLGPQPDPDRQHTSPRLIEFDFDPAKQDPIVGWQVVTTSEACLRCLRPVEAGEHMAITVRGRKLCTDCAT
ncbi:hypothetical protein SAMN05421812_12846 [Asanoa hainanensis]|uniref:Uncharacterized protein n=1 Tax=Asanoa hainanensis TaxID=560556 RepID=A0A239PFY2_9ACTN|nr:hypothetical protein [Asanoa hainanensis]SNT65900.1 hypothetical protein SAMN05421812_12846 [Asanoa hainanensis]